MREFLRRFPPNVAGQTVGALMAVAGLFLILPVGWFLLCTGGLLAAVSTAAEWRGMLGSWRRGGG